MSDKIETGVLALTKTDEILALLSSRPMTSEEIERATGLTKNKLWGLMKSPLQRMKVKRTTQGFWAIDKTYDEEIERGVKYLRSIGWIVIPPKGMK
jgi:DNA-binding IclR family transcriptional regulator